MDERLKELMQELGNAINESLSDSDRIAEAIGAIKRAGYDMFLVLEATIGFNRREDAPEPPHPSSYVSSGPVTGTDGKVKWTAQDLRFLAALKIEPDDTKQR